MSVGTEGSVPSVIPQLERSADLRIARYSTLRRLVDEQQRLWLVPAIGRWRPSTVARLENWRSPRESRILLSSNDRPGRIVRPLSTVVKDIVGTHTASVIKYYHRTHQSSSVRESETLADTWVYVIDPSEEELDELVRMDGLERDLLQDAVDPNEVPRIQQERDVTYFFLRAPSGTGDQAQTVPLLVAIAPTFLITVSRQPFSWLERFLHGTAPYSTEWRSQLVWRIMLELNARYNNAINDIARRVRGNIGPNQGIQNEDILRLVAFEGVLNDFLAGLQPMNVMLTNVMAGKHIKLYDDDKDLMEDVLLGNNQVLEAGRAQLRTTVNMREAYSVIATNDLNRVIKFLTLVTVVLTVPMVVSGLYGMNVALPLGGHPLAFLFVIFVTVAVILGLLQLLSRKRLL